MMGGRGLEWYGKVAGCCRTGMSFRAPTNVEENPRLTEKVDR